MGYKTSWVCSARHHIWGCYAAIAAVFGGLYACGGADERTERTASVSSALTTRQRQILGFEVLADWTVVGGTASNRTLSTNRTEGAASLSVTTNKAVTLGSAPLSTLGAFNTVSINVTSPQTNASYRGSIRVALNSRTQGLSNALIGERELGTSSGFAAYVFTLPEWIIRRLQGKTYEDLSFRITVQPGQEEDATYLLDHISLSGSGIPSVSPPFTQVPADAIVATDASPLPDGTSRAAGALRGRSDVLPNGAFKHTIPIEVPEGRAGMKPDLALVYDSTHGNDPMLGVGWSLAGLSRIHHCPKTRAQHGYSEATRTPDRLRDADWAWDVMNLCLDGQPLVRVDTPGCPAGGDCTQTHNYRTERDQFTRVTPIPSGATAELPGFVAETKDGRRLEYLHAGYGLKISKLDQQGVPVKGDAAVPLARYLSRIVDRSGNSIEYSYLPGHLSPGPWPNPTLLIDRIDYTRIDNQTCTSSTCLSYGDSGRSVRFKYEDREDAVGGYVAGIKYESKKRLKSIEIYTSPSAAKPVRYYNLKYHTSPATGRSRLYSIQLCAVDACLPETTFTWGTRGKLFQPWFQSIGATFSFARDYRNEVQDPLPGLLMYDAYVTAGAQYSVTPALGDVDQNSFPPSPPLIGDFDGNGQDDLILMAWAPGGGAHEQAVLLLSEGTVDAPTLRRIELPLREIRDNVWVSPLPSRVVDIDQDGVAEVFFRDIAKGKKCNTSSDCGSGTCETGAGFCRCAAGQSCTWMSGSDEMPGFSVETLHRLEVNSVPTLTKFKPVGVQFWDYENTNVKPVLFDIDGDGILDLIHNDGFHFDGKLLPISGPKVDQYVVRLGRKVGGQLSWGERINFTTPAGFIQPLPTSTWGRSAVLDSDNDGRAEFHTLDPFNGYSWFGLDSEGQQEGFFGKSAHSTDGYEFLKLPLVGIGTGHIHFADLNGDGLKEAVSTYLAPGFNSKEQRVFSARMNIGTGWLKAPGGPISCSVSHAPDGVCQVKDPGGPYGGKYDSGLRVTDFNLDGLDDLISFGNQIISLPQSGIPPEPDGAVTGPIALCISRSTSEFEPPEEREVTCATIPSKQPRFVSSVGWVHPQIGDFNGDGLPDIVQYVKVDGKAPFNAGLQLLVQAPSNRDDIITKITSNSFVTDELTYKSAPLSQIGPNPEITCPDGLSCPRRGFNVVTDAVFRRGGANEHFQYQYAKPVVDYAGRGFLGFGEFRVTDLRRGLQTITEFDHTSYIGNLAGKHVFSKAFLPSRVETNTVKTAELVSADPTYFVQRKTVVDYAYEFRWTVQDKTYTVENTSETISEYDGPQSKLFRTTAISRKYDSYGTLNDETVTTKDKVGVVTSVHQTAIRQLRNDPLTWSLGLPEYVITSSTAGGETHRRHTLYVYDSRGIVIRKLADAQKGILPWSYGSRQMLDTRFIHDEAGLLRFIEERDRVGDVRSTAIAYDATGTHAQHFQNTLGHNTWVGYHSSVDKPVIIVDPNGVKTTIQYDGFGRTKAIRPGAGADTTWNYLETRQPGELAIETRTEGASAVTTEYISPRGLRGLVETVLDSKRVVAWTMYDILGRIEDVYAPYGSDEAATKPTKYKYDNLDAVRLITDPDGASVEVQRTEPLQTTIISRTDQTRQQKITRNANGEIIEKIDVASPDVKMTFSYGPFGVLKKVLRDQQLIAEFDYNGFGAETVVITPSSGRVETTYNSFGEPQRVERKGASPAITYDYTYDPIGRLTSVETPNASNRYIYDAGAGAIGKLVKDVSHDRTSGPRGLAIVKQHEYDSMGRASATQYDIGSLNFRTGVDYDSLGRPWHITYPAAENYQLTITQNYDPVDGLLKRIDRGATKLWERKVLDSFGHVKLSEIAGTISREEILDPNSGRLKSIKVSRGSQKLNDVAYDYYAGGNVFLRTDGSRAETTQYTYDQLDRITKVELRAGGTIRTTEYEYDYWGNQDKVDGVKVKNFEDGQAYDRLTGTIFDGATYEYDGLGRQTSKLVGSNKVRRIGYSDFDLPQYITNDGVTSTFLYDAHQNRVAKNVPSSSGVFFGELVVYVEQIYEYRQVFEPKFSSRQHVFYIRAGDQLVGQIAFDEKTGEEVFTALQQDLHGNVVSTTTNTTAFDIWGNQTESPLPNVTRGFTGHEHDDEVGLINMGGRIYDPTTGTFLTPDPVVDVLNSQSWNRYAYVLNNPVKYTDPSGFRPEGGAIGAIGPLHPPIDREGPGPTTSREPEPQRTSCDSACQTFQRIQSRGILVDSSRELPRRYSTHYSNTVSSGYSSPSGFVQGTVPQQHNGNVAPVKGLAAVPCKDKERCKQQANLFNFSGGLVPDGLLVGVVDGAVGAWTALRTWWAGAGPAAAPIASGIPIVAQKWGERNATIFSRAAELANGSKLFMDHLGALAKAVAEKVPHCVFRNHLSARSETT